MDSAQHGAQPVAEQGAEHSGGGPDAGHPRVPRSPAGDKPSSSRGSVTLEAAFVLPVLILVAATAMALLSTAAQAWRCENAARTAAASLQAGRTPAQARAVALHNAPEHAQVLIEDRDGVRWITVSALARPGVPWIPKIGLHSRLAVAAPSWGTAEPGVPTMITTALQLARSVRDPVNLESNRTPRMADHPTHPNQPP